jgi:hypothetical protein
MGAINYGRVILGGLAAGLVLNVVDFVVQGVLLKDQWAEVMKALNKPPVEGHAIAVFVVMDFLYGIIMAYLYAAIRPRMGAGARTGLCAGLLVWSIAGLLGNIGMAPLGIIPSSMLIISAAVWLPTSAVAGIVAGWLYREEDAETRAA